MFILLTLLAETGAAPQAHAPQLMDVDGTIFIQLGLFALLAVIMTKLLWKPYLRVRGERVNRIDGYRKDAVRMEADAASRLSRAELALAEARRVGSGERALARAEALAHEQALLAAAQKDAQRVLAAAQVRLDGTVAAERARMEAGARETASRIAGRILGREVSP